MTAPDKLREPCNQMFISGTFTMNCNLPTEHEGLHKHTPTTPDKLRERARELCCGPSHVETLDHNGCQRCNRIAAALAAVRDEALEEALVGVPTFINSLDPNNFTDPVWIADQVVGILRALKVKP